MTNARTSTRRSGPRRRLGHGSSWRRRIPASPIPSTAPAVTRSRRSRSATSSMRRSRTSSTPTWSTTCGEPCAASSRSKHRKYAARAFLDAVEALALPARSHPAARRRHATARAAHRVSLRARRRARAAAQFYGSFGEHVFFSTQYIRHHSSPLYTPEPDIVHEVLGHANQLADPATARLYRLVGAAVAPGRDRRSVARPLAGLLVHVRVRGRRGRRRPEGLRRRHPLVVRRARRLPAGDDPAARLRRDDPRRLRHHDVPADAVRGAIAHRGLRRARSVPHLVQRRDAVEIGDDDRARDRASRASSPSSPGRSHPSSRA